MKKFWKSKINFVAIAMILVPFLEQLDPALVQSVLGEHGASIAMSVIGVVLFILRTFFTDKKLVVRKPKALSSSLVTDMEAPLEDKEAVPPTQSTGCRGKI